MLYNSMITINRQVGYSVREIITPESNFDYWTEDSDEDKLLEKADKEGYTYFPTKAHGVINGIMKVESLKSGEKEIIPLTHDWLISADMPILELLALFSKDNTRNFFVLSSDKIVGIISPADLSRVPARASFYLLIAHFETLLTELIRQKIGESESELVVYLENGALGRAIGKRKNDIKNDIEIPIIHYLNLKNLVTIINNSHLQDDLKLLNHDEDLSSIYKFRNSISHTNQRLIDSKGDIPKVNADCTNLIEYSQKILKFIQAN